MSNEATGTEIVPHKVKLKEVLKGSEGELIVLQDFEQTKETLVEVARKYENLVITKENLKEGKEARAEIREFRFGVQNITKHNKDLLNKAKNEMEDTMGGLIELIKPTEDKLDAQIKEIENAVKIEKERKEQEERERIAKDFYHNFIDTIVETIKMISISNRTLNKRMGANIEVLNALYDSGKNVQLMAGHFFNWEFANLGYSHNFKYPLLTVYMPISNKALNKIFINMRKKFGANLIAATEFATKFAGYNKQQYCLALVGDQNPGSPENAYWTNFFGKMTPIVKGPERGARVANTAIVMCNFYKVKRGYYKTDLVLLTTEPRSLPQGDITKQMISFVEDSIRKNPSGYLWSHRRWKWEFDAEKYKKLVI